MTKIIPQICENFQIPQIFFDTIFMEPKLVFCKFAIHGLHAKDNSVDIRLNNQISQPPAIIGVASGKLTICWQNGVCVLMVVLFGWALACREQTTTGRPRIARHQNVLEGPPSIAAYIIIQSSSLGLEISIRVTCNTTTTCLVLSPK